MTHALLQVLSFQCVQDIEEIGTRRALAHGILVWKVRLEAGIFLEHRVDVSDRQLVVMGDLHVSDICLLEQLLLADQDVLEKVFCDHCLVRQVVL